MTESVKNVGIGHMASTSQTWVRIIFFLIDSIQSQNVLIRLNARTLGQFNLMLKNLFYRPAGGQVTSIHGVSWRGMGLAGRGMEQFEFRTKFEAAGMQSLKQLSQL